VIKSASRSSITNDQKYRSMLAGAVPSSEYLIESRVLGTNSATVVFDNLDQFSGVYRHLMVVATPIITVSGTLAYMHLNGDTGTNYSRHYLDGNASTAFSSGEANSNSMYFAYWNAGDVQPSAVVCEILDAYSTTKNKSARSIGGRAGTSPMASVYSGSWRNTSPISSITIASTQNFQIGSRFSLYGMTA
jgi:hypothetical protein